MVSPEQVAEEARTASCKPEMSFSFVKRTLFEANSKARRFGRASLTSVLTGRLLLATPQTVKPGLPNIAAPRGRKRATPPPGNFLSPFCGRRKECNRFLSVSCPRFMRKGRELGLSERIL
jgi:hypothetical protein